MSPTLCSVRRRADDLPAAGATAGPRAPGRAAVPPAIHATGPTALPPADPPDPPVDPVIAAQLRTALRVISRGTPLLLRGETGAGKEVFARGVHADSAAAGRAFIAINCAGLPDGLIESELFGYRAGAFTGADRNGRRGKIVQAHGGTLFLDEIGDMPLALQARLLRVLDERRVTPLGSEESIPVSFQLVSASHRELARLVAEGSFREDLYYRLNGVEIVLPPLRERADRRELIDRMLAEEAGAPLALTPAAEALLMNHAWPGNLRQMRHVLRAAAALCDGSTVDVEHLPALRSTPFSAAQARAQLPLAEAAIAAEERDTLLDLIREQRWNLTRVARLAGVSRNTLYRRMKRLGIALDPD
ncbi:sigma-54-dependent Fis family transcriptional regulator [Derxia lacustris]|uniref:sigma-54-dependent Fis family transcriptional regulator n=1 Tax=Derxia lacustris TaxID=764842 RepID=UPI0038B370FD